MIHLKRIPQGICLTISSLEQYLWDYRRILPWISLETFKCYITSSNILKRELTMLKKLMIWKSNSIFRLIFKNIR
jgi:hypothetical protein